MINETLAAVELRITERLVKFYEALVERGEIPPAHQGRGVTAYCMEDSGRSAGPSPLQGERLCHPEQQQRKHWSCPRD
jgi:hypothetical protein